MPSPLSHSERSTETDRRDAVPAPGAEPSAPLSGALPRVAAPAGCCGLGKVATACLAVTLLLVVATAAYVAGRARGLAERAGEPGVWAGQLPPIDATGAVSSEQFSLATGLVTDEAEGMFVLDHNSGLLQCSVIYPRIGRFMAHFTANVGDALPTGGKGGQYIMATGSVDFPRASNRPIGSAVVYVLDTATGNYACYGVPFDRGAMSTGRGQQGVLALLATGTANPVLDRDALR